MQKLDFNSPLHFDEFAPVSNEQWESIIEADLKGKDYKKTLKWNSGDGFSPLPFYRKDTLGSLHHTPDILKQSGAWNITEAIESNDPKTANHEALQALENGAMGLLFCPAKNYLHSSSDLHTLLEGIHADYIELHFGTSISTADLPGWLESWCQEKEIDPDKLNMSFNADPFASAIRSGHLLNRNDLDKFLQGFGHDLQHVMIDNTVYGESGANIVQQLALALAAGNELLGLAPEEHGGSIKILFTTGSHYFMEIAKFRAFRLMWKQVSEQYGITEPAPQLIARTALWNKSRTDAHNNMLRTTTEAMSAALGGCDTFILHRYDRHFDEDSDFSSRIARNTQLILQEEAYLDKVADPGAGSYYIEKLTDELASASWELFQEIEKKGGLYECLKIGFVQKMITSSRDERVQAYKEQEKVMVGVNKYRPDGEGNSSPGVQWTTPADTNFSEDRYFSIQALSPLNIEFELEKGDA